MRGGRGRRRCDIHPVARCSSSSRVLNGCSGRGTQHLAEWIFILTFHGHSFGGRLQNPSGKGQGDNQNGEKHNYQEAKLAFTPLLELTQRNTQQQKNDTRIRGSALTGCMQTFHSISTSQKHETIAVPNFPFHLPMLNQLDFCI